MNQSIPYQLSYKDLYHVVAVSTIQLIPENNKNNHTRPIKISPDSSIPYNTMAPATIESPATTVASSDEVKPSPKDASPNAPYQGPPLPCVAEDLVVPSVLHPDSIDERLWVPQAPNVWFRPILFSVSQGYFVNLLRVRKSGILSRHRHAGPVHATVLKGRWHYLEHDWWAEEGGYALEPPGDIHTLEVPGDVTEMITMFHVTGAYIYVDVHGNPQGVEDVFSKLRLAKDHYEKVGLGAGFVDQFIR